MLLLRDETLGSVTLTSDGTLTENRVTVLDVAGNSSFQDRLAGAQTAPVAPARAQAGDRRGGRCPVILERKGTFAIRDPPEGAFVLSAPRFGLLKPEMERLLPRVNCRST
ncbi:MAG: hypothetical protein U0670_12065 [Anaerolineae bacterium]